MKGHKLVDATKKFVAQFHASIIDHSENFKMTTSTKVAEYRSGFQSLVQEADGYFLSELAERFGVVTMLHEIGGNARPYAFLDVEDDPSDLGHNPTDDFTASQFDVVSLRMSEEPWM